MNIGLDMMGGDFAPLEAVKGVFQYFEEVNSTATLVLIGDKNKIDPLLIEYPGCCRPGQSGSCRTSHRHA